jgi:hypothetical protein
MPRPKLFASAESAKTAAARSSAAQIETLFNIVVLRVTEFRQLFNANEVALIPPVLVDLGPTLLKFDIASRDRANVLAALCRGKANKLATRA